MKTVIKLILVGSLMLTNQVANAWGATGHRIIAEIAENHLNKKTKKNLRKIIGNQKLAYWSNWADFIKSDPDSLLNSTGSWHFVNAPANQSFSEYVKVMQESPDNNLFKSYLRIKDDARTWQKASQTQRERQLYYILHLVADAHQPMHAGRAEDLGGNKISVTFFGQKTNIHRVWDSDLIDHEKYSYTEYARVLDINNQDYKKYTAESSWEMWLYETHQVANKIYDDIHINSTLSYPYIYSFKYIMEDCLLKAGLRLAKELNEVYGS